MFTVIRTADKEAKRPVADDEILKAVLECGTEQLLGYTAKNLKNSHKQTIWHIALKHQAYSTIDFLLGLGKGHDSLDEDGNSALDLAIEIGDVVLLRRLIHDAGFRKCCIFKAAKNTEIFCILAKEAKRNMYEINHQGRSALHAACMHGNYELASILMTSGLNVNLEDCFGYTPLHYAIHKRNLELVVFLKTNRAVLNRPKRYFANNSRFKPVLNEALSVYAFEILDYLLDEGADPNALDDCGRNSVNLACEMKLPTVIITNLLKNGADPQIVDKNGKCAFDSISSNLSILTFMYNHTKFDIFTPQDLTHCASDCCPICKDSIENENIPVIPCSHRFHSECLQVWQETSLACPLCSKLTVTLSFQKRKTRMNRLIDLFNKRR